MIDKNSIDEIKERVNLVDIADKYIKLTKFGSRFRALCPFHSEKTPSFYVNDSFYHCFGCGESGDAISFLMKIKGVSFVNAIEELAQYAGIVLYKTSSRDNKKFSANKKNLYDINLSALSFFRNQLESNKEVIAYLNNRGISTATIREFAIGFAPAGIDLLCQYLLAKGFSEQTILSASLARKNSAGNIYDFFRDRIVIPVFNDKGQVIGFGARIFSNSSNQPKYINSPETLIYKKKRVLFGVNKTLPFIKEKKSVFLVEGYFDLISLYQAGIRNVVATCGTALTKDHIKKLSYVCNRAYLLFDSDRAGIDSAAKSFDVFLNFPIEPKVIFLPQGEDPDSYIRKASHPSQDILLSLEQDDLFSLFIRRQALSLFGLDDLSKITILSAKEKGILVKHIVPIINKITNPVERDELLNKLAFYLKIDKNNIKTLMFDKKNIVLSSEGSESKEGISLDIQVLSLVLFDFNYISKFLNTPEVLQIMSSNLLACLNDMSQLEARDKEALLEVIKEYYSNSVIHKLKTSFKAITDPEVSADKVFLDIVNSAKRILLQRAINNIEDSLNNLSDGEEKAKAELIQYKINLRGKLVKLFQQERKVNLSNY